MTVSSKHLKYLVDAAWEEFGDDMNYAYYNLTCQIIYKFGKKFVPSFNENKFYAYLERKEKERYVSLI